MTGVHNTIVDFVANWLESIWRCLITKAH